MSMKDQEGMNIMYSLSLEKDYYQVDAQLLKEKLSFVYLHGITEDLCNELYSPHQGAVWPFLLFLHPPGVTTVLIRYALYSIQSCIRKSILPPPLLPSPSLILVSIPTTLHLNSIPLLATWFQNTWLRISIVKCILYGNRLNSNSTRKSSIDIHQLKLEVFIFSQAWDSMKQYLH